MDINKVVAAIIDIKDYKAITKTLATAKEALMKDLEELDFKMELDINKRNIIFNIR